MIGRVCCVLAWLAVVAGARSWASDLPSVTAAWDGPAEVVFDTEASACERVDLPDGIPRAFRDYTGTVHLFAPNSIARAMVGPNLNEVKLDCHVVYRSPEDPDPAHFQDQNWLNSFYTEDGRNVVALVHSEYHGATHPGMCATQLMQAGQEVYDCWWNTITLAVSHDGGYSFREPDPPNNLVASMPYVFDRANTAGAVGYHEPTNIIKFGSNVYAMLKDWPFKAQKYGPCLIRTAEPFVASSWRAWGGTDFTIRFMNPYAEHGTPEDHVCTPSRGGRNQRARQLVDRAAARSLCGRRVHPRSPVWAAWTLPFRFRRPDSLGKAISGGEHWDDADRRTTGAMEVDGYFALLDPASADRNFATVSDTPFVYYIRFNLVRGNLSRALMRRRIRLRVGS